MHALSIYVHIPWCELKCPYCDFNSHVLSNSEDFSDYTKALEYDLDEDLARHSELSQREVSTIFIGGGTPSLLEAAHVEDILAMIARKFKLAKNIEITLEANPGSSEAVKFKLFRQAGVTRLSIGVQSFDDQMLQGLGRIHDEHQALSAIDAAHAANFESFNVDLMYGLPGQSVAQALSDLEQGIDADSTHLSCYQLTIEANTLFFSKPPELPQSETIWRMHTSIRERLENQGFEQYEISAYAKDQRYCRHNLNYWNYGDYLGIGAGAHSKISLSDNSVRRFYKMKLPKSYLSAFAEKRSMRRQEVKVDAANQKFEFMLNALRLRDGFSLDTFEQRTSCARSDIEPILQRFEEQNLLLRKGEHIRLSERGYAMTDSLLESFLPAK